MAMTRKLTFCTVFIALMVPCFGVALANDVEAMLSQRTTSLWIEGDRLGDMVIGARTLMEFIYVDSALSRVAAENGPDVPDWLNWHAHHFGTKATKKRVLLIVRFEARKRWDLDPTRIRINGRNVVAEDILSPKDLIPTGELPPGSAGSFAIGIPVAAFAGKDGVSVAYGEYSTNLLIPGTRK